MSVSTHEFIVRALVLSREHRVLLLSQRGAWSIPEVRAHAADDALPAIRKLLTERLGLTLNSPVGSRVGADDALAFIASEANLATRDARWVPLAEATKDEWVWSTYVQLLLGGYEPPSRALDVCMFGAGEEMAAQLAHLVVCGDKRGTTLWLRTALLDGLTIPYPGLMSVVTDGFGLPRCVIETIDVERLRFCDVTAEHAQLEAEGDRSLRDFYEGHLSYFQREAAAHDLSFDVQEEVMFERFRVLHVLGHP